MEIDSEGIKGSTILRRALASEVFHHLAKVNGEINRMNTQQLIDKLKYYNLDTCGNNDLLRRRLKNNYRNIKLANLNGFLLDKLDPYFVIIDFEATCLSIRPPDFKQEIIEFPAVLVNSISQKIEDTFQMYCKPKINPQLSDFCIELTGITQDQVDSAASFEEVFSHFEMWMKSHDLGKKHKFSIVTDSPWDMSRFLFQQCQYSNVPYPGWGKKWVNLKRAFSSFYKCNQSTLKNMLNYVGMEFEGRLHCGLDDAKNIARLLIRMIRDGARICPNEKMSKFTTPDVDKGKNESGIEKINENELKKKMENLRIRACFTVIENKNKLLTFERVKKEMSFLERKENNDLKQNSSLKKESEEDKEMMQWIPYYHLKNSRGRKKLKAKVKN